MKYLYPSGKESFNRHFLRATAFLSHYFPLTSGPIVIIQGARSEEFHLRSSRTRAWPGKQGVVLRKKTKPRAPRRGAATMLLSEQVHAESGERGFSSARGRSSAPWWWRTRRRCRRSRSRCRSSVSVGESSAPRDSLAVGYMDS
jgi:hypothetical protein